MESYACDRCGACCRGHLIVEADELDILREPKLVSADKTYAGCSVDEVIERFQSEIGRCLIIACGSPCRFLRENRCSIYPTRPNVCVGLPPGSEQCQLARQEEAIARLGFTRSE